MDNNQLYTLQKATAVSVNAELGGTVRTRKDQRRDFVKPLPNGKIVANVRYGDGCGNGHNTLAITGEVWDYSHSRREPDSCGMIHDEIAAHFPELRDALPWHLTSTDGPMHYFANTLFHAGDLDHNGLAKGQRQQIRRNGTPLWELTAFDADGNKMPVYKLNSVQVAADECPTSAYTLRWVSWDTVGEGKARQLDHARSAAVWPDATDEQLCLPRDELVQLLADRLPDVLRRFHAVVTGLGFTY